MSYSIFIVCDLIYCCCDDEDIFRKGIILQLKRLGIHDVWLSIIIDLFILFRFE